MFGLVGFGGRRDMERCVMFEWVCEMVTALRWMDVFHCAGRGLWLH